MKSILLLLNDGVKLYLDNPNVQVFLSSTVKITVSHLNKIRYLPYQQELWDIIKEKHYSGIGYRIIPNWLNENGYKIPRGHEFKNTNAFSIFHLFFIIYYTYKMMSLVINQR